MSSSTSASSKAPWDGISRYQPKNGSSFPLTAAALHVYAAADCIAQSPIGPPALLRRSQTVALIIKSPNLFPDNWIYIHEPGVKVGRIQNLKKVESGNGPRRGHFLPGPGVLLLRGRWPLEHRRRRSGGALSSLGLARAEDIVDGCVVRMPKAYPVFDEFYQRGIVAIRGFLAATPNLRVVGRNGMHRYNNQDHSMPTAMLAARNIVSEMRGIGPRYDLWKVDAAAGAYTADEVII